MSRCFTKFPISGLGEPNIYQNLVCFTRMWEDCGGVSDCEEIVGEVNHTTECVTDLLISICVRIVYCFTPSERNVG